MFAKNTIRRIVAEGRRGNVSGSRPRRKNSAESIAHLFGLCSVSNHDALMEYYAAPPSPTRRTNLREQTTRRSGGGVRPQSTVERPAVQLRATWSTPSRSTCLHSRDAHMRRAGNFHSNEKRRLCNRVYCTHIRFKRSSQRRKHHRQQTSCT